MILVSTNTYEIRRNVTIEQTHDGRWMVLEAGLQWAPLVCPRDASGAGSATYRTPEEAEEDYLTDAERLERWMGEMEVRYRTA